MTHIVNNMTPPERVLYRIITLTWLFYGLGALYVIGPVLGWSIAGFTAVSLFLTPLMKPEFRASAPPATVWVWIICMLGMLVVLWVGHFDNSLGTGKTIKSSIGWAKGWALFALFIMVGASLNIRPKFIIRAQCVLGLQTVLLLPLFIMAPKIGLPEKLFVSPIRAVGGPGPEYFSVYLYTIDPSNGAARWQFYTPWSPFAGLVGVIVTLCALEEKNKFWKTCGLIAGLAIVLMTKSRMSLMGVVICGSLPRLLPLILKSWVWFALTAIASVMVVFGGRFISALSDAVYAFRAMRADSTRVRDALQSIAGERWRTEAPWFGHGIVEPGAHVTEYMLIGTHHTWYGLLFVKGTVGAIMLAIPMIWTLLVLSKQTIMTKEARLPLGLILALLLFSFGENMEVQLYILWPALILIGTSLNTKPHQLETVTAPPVKNIPRMRQTVTYSMAVP